MVPIVQKAQFGVAGPMGLPRGPGFARYQQMIGGSGKQSVAG